MRFACLLVPNFLVAIARRDDPSLRRRPVIVGGSPEEHAQVSACSEEAAAAGVTIGTTLRRALALCSKAVFLPVREATAADEARRITDLLALYSPAIEEIAPGHVHFDIHGLAKMTGLDDETYLADLHEAALSATGLPVRLAAAQTVFAAHAAAQFPIHDPSREGRFTIRATGNARTRHSRVGILGTRDSLGTPDSWVGTWDSGLTQHSALSTQHFLPLLPVEVLPVPPLIHLRLRLFGIERLEQVAELSFSAMQAQFGREGARAWELAHGRDTSGIVPKRDELRVSVEIELPAPAAFSEPIVVGTRTLIERALNHQDVRGQTLRRLDWQLTLESGEQIARKLVFREPTNDPRRMLFPLKGKIERLQLVSPATSIAITLSGICSEYGHQANLWQVGPRRRRELQEAIEQLNAREGAPQVFQIVEVQPWSRIPERQLALAPYGA